MYNVYTKKTFGSAFTTDTDTSCLETGNEKINLRSGLGIDEEVIHIDYHHHGFTHKETRIKLRRQ